MAFNIVYQDVNIVCTNMTSGVPRQIGCEPEPRFEITQTGAAPILTCQDCKISNSFECKIPKSLFGGLLGFLAGVVVGVAVGVAAVAVVALVIGTGGIGAAAIGAISFLVGDCVAAAITVAAGALVVGAVTYGYQSKHDCDIVLGMTWSISHQNILIHEQYAIVDQSLLECPKGGLITIIEDDAIAQDAANMISNSNNEQIKIECKNQFIQGIIGGVTGSANPVSLCISGGFYMYDWWFNTKQSYHKEMYEQTAYEESTTADKIGTVVDTSYGIYDSGKDVATAAKASAKAESNAVAQAKGAERLTQEASEKGTKAAIKRSNIQNNVAENAASVAKNAKIDKYKKIAKGAASIALGIVGGVAASKVGDFYDNEENDMEVTMIKNLKNKIKKDREKSNGKIVSFEL